MNSYNIQITKLREAKQLSLKDAAKGIGISRLSLYLYENGYFRPTKKTINKIESFYKKEISFEGDNVYPSPSEKKVIKSNREPLKVKRIIFGSISGFFLIASIIGAVLFNSSVNNVNSFYGEAYNEMRYCTQQVGSVGHDLVTGLEYKYVIKEEVFESTTFLFYETDNLLYFNECTFSTTLTSTELGIGRFHYHFGSNLGVDSHLCEFTYSSTFKGSSFTCTFDYKGGPISEIIDFKNNVKGTIELTEELAIRLVNQRINEAEKAFSKLLSSTMNKATSFYGEFLNAREQGRKINFYLQIAGLLMIFQGIIGFFIFFGIFLHLLLKNIRPRLILTEPEKEKQNYEPLPKDWKVNFGIPDIIVFIFSRVLQYGSILLLLLAFLANVGLGLPEFMANPVFLNVMRLSLLAGIFLEHFIVIGRIKKASTLFKTIIRNVAIFLFIATIETVLISLTNAWGYDLASLVYSYVPSNVYQVVALHYLIYLFLFFQPSFLKEGRKADRIVWHALSIIPLGILVASYFLSNGYALVYGVKENIFINFWFPNGFLPLSVVCVLFLYITFGIRLYFEKKYGQHNAQYFFYGDRYGLYENLICASLILIVGLLDLFFRNNQYAYYLGLGNNVWVFAIIPFILLCKYSPNSQQIFLIGEERHSEQK